MYARAASLSLFGTNGHEHVSQGWSDDALPMKRGGTVAVNGVRRGTSESQVARTRERAQRMRRRQRSKRHRLFPGRAGWALEPSHVPEHAANPPTAPQQRGSIEGGDVARARRSPRRPGRHSRDEASNTVLPSRTSPPRPFRAPMREKISPENDWYRERRAARGFRRRGWGRATASTPAAHSLLVRALGRATALSWPRCGYRHRQRPTPVSSLSAGLMRASCR